jgi:hypothetical protein
VPIRIIVRSRAGKVLLETTSSDEGSASLPVCWRDEDPAWQVEARLEYGAQFVGSIVSFYSYTDTYCLYLPAHVGGHCGEWGTGPVHLLAPTRESQRRTVAQ